MPEALRMAAPVYDIPVGDIRVGERLRAVKDDDALAKLAESIATDKQKVPIIVRPVHPSLESGFELVAGARRLAAIIKNGGATIRAVIEDFNTEPHPRHTEIIENVHRLNLTADEKARHAIALWRDNPQLPITTVARIVGISFEIAAAVQKQAIAAGEIEAVETIELQNGRRRTVGDALERKREKTIALLKGNPDQLDVWIATQVELGTSTVGEIRGELEAAGEIPRRQHAPKIARVEELAKARPELTNSELAKLAKVSERTVTTARARQKVNFAPTDTSEQNSPRPRGRPPATPATPRTRVVIGERIVEQFSDGQWHTLDEIAAAFPDVTAVTIRREVTRRILREGAYNATAETREHRGVDQYRIVRMEKAVSLVTLTEALRPIIRALMAEGAKHSARISAATVAEQGVRLQRLLDGWSQ